MENNLQKSPKLGHPSDSSDAKYVSGLSTILVATIQEAKDRISQIEYIFCSQLFPNFQLNPQILKKIYSEAREAAENEYKQKEIDLLLQIEKLQCEKQQAVEENQLLKEEKTKILNMGSQDCSGCNELQKELKQKITEVNEGREVHQNLQKLLESNASMLHSYGETIKDLEEKNTLLRRTKLDMEVEIEKLRREVKKKCKEVDYVMELKNELIQTNQSKLAQEKAHVMNYIEKSNRLILELERTERKVNELQSQLKDKTDEVKKGKELQGNLLRKIDNQSLEIMNQEQLLNDYEKEKRPLVARVESLVKLSEELQNEVGMKNSEIEELREVQMQLLQQVNSFNSERNNKGHELKEFDKERKKLQDIQRGLEEKVDKLQQCLHERTKESSEGMELHGKLLQQIEVKDSELLIEKRKRRDVFDAYKRLKSQYNYLLKKYALTQESMEPLEKMENESEISRHDQTPAKLDDTKNNASKASSAANEVLNPESKQEISGAVLIQKTSPMSPPPSGILIAPKCPSSMKSWPPSGAKRPISYWRDNRSHQSRVGPDPHDDFLDTPLENARGKNSGKAMKEDVPDFPKPGPLKMSLDNSDDETEDMNVDIGPGKRHISPPKAGTSSFKYVEPVRKKAERENLKGVECKQCKKFYDAVLPDEGKDANVNKQNVRCEHQDGVSRHRYRYAPPLTPEGFWNIGFESEM